MNTIKEENLSFQLGERDTENERLKTTVVALNEKLMVFNDIEKDLKITQASLKESENSRYKLQANIHETGQKRDKEGELM